jgi:iron complex outermembrane receptor protein
MSAVSRRLLAATALLPLAQAAHAEELAALGHDTILVVGQREKPISIEPRGLSVSLGEAQFAGVNAFNVEDLMKYAPDFFVRKRFIGDNNAVPGFRGTHSVQSARALVMVDGFLISNFLGNSFAFPPKWGVVGPGEVKQFDIVYGPYSARYPGNSMGGIINIETRDPEETEAFVTAQRFLQPYDQYGTHEDLWGWSAEAGAAFKQENGPFSLRISARRLENRGQPQQFYQLSKDDRPVSKDDRPDPAVPVTGASIDPKLFTSPAPIFGDYSPVDTRQDQVRAKIGFESGDFRAHALFTYSWNKEDETRPNTYLRDAAGNPVYGGNSRDNIVRVQFGGQGYTATGSNLTIRDKREWLGGLKFAGPVAGFDLRLNLSTVQIERQRVRMSSGYAQGIANGAGQATVQGPTGWYSADLLARRTIGAHDVALGAQANLFRSDQSIYATTNWRAATGRMLSSRTFGKTRAIGLFAEDEFHLSDNASITAGVRADFWRAFDGGLLGRIARLSYDDRNDSALSPSLSGKLELVPGWSAQLSLAQATRFPTVGELFQGTLDGLGNFNPASFDPDLKPERSTDANLLLRHDIGAVSLTGSLFWQRVKDSLFTVARFETVTINNVSNTIFVTNVTNIDLTRQYGAELILEARNWPMEGLDIDANASWVDAETVRNRADPLSEGVQFPRIPRWRLNGSIRYALTEKVQASLGFRYASRPNTDLKGELRGDTYGYTSELFAMDARVNWMLPSGFRLSAGVDNITNDRAWVFHPYPQRTFLVEAGWRL